MDADAAASARFLNSIGVKLVPKQVPIAAPKTERPAKPQAPIESKPVDRDAEFKRRYDAELDAQIEFERHPDLFDDSEGGWANVQIVLDYVKENHDGYLSRQAVSDAISTLRRRGELLTLFRPEPEVAKDTTGSAPNKQPEKQPVVLRQSPPTTIPDPDDGLPPLPDYVKRVLGSNKLRNRKDVHAIPTQLYSDLYRGPFAEEFRNRVNAALAR